MKNLFSTAPRTYGDILYKSETKSIGDGQCSIEHYDYQGNFLFEVCQENGTRCTAEEHEESEMRANLAIEIWLKKLISLNDRINLRGARSISNF